MIDQQALANAIAEIAAKWIDPEYPLRRSVVEETLDLENRFTEEAMAFAINQQMALLDSGALLAWIGDRKFRVPKTVGVLNAGNIPLVDLQDWLAVILSGAAYRGVLSSKSPLLLPAFAGEVFDLYPDLDIDFVEFDELFDQIDALIASGSDETIAAVEARCSKQGLSKEHCLLRKHRFSIALLSGNESKSEKDRLAEDVLLHEGLGCRNVSLIWAPEGLSPDSYLEAFAKFRSIFPVHPLTPGSLKMKQAFLNAIGASHAYGEGMEFLVSRGEPEVQEPGHVRWVAYRTREELVSWIKNHEEVIQLVVTGNQGADLLDLSLPILPFGEAQRPALNWCADGIDTIAFLFAL